MLCKSHNKNNKFIAECKDAELKGIVHPHTPETDIDKLMKVWSDIFPQRSIIYNDSRFYADDPANEQKEACPLLFVYSLTAFSSLLARCRAGTKVHSLHASMHRGPWFVAYAKKEGGTGRIVLPIPPAASVFMA